MVGTGGRVSCLLCLWVEGVRSGGLCVERVGGGRTGGVVLRV